MQDWETLRFFYWVGVTGSYSQAAQKLGVNVTTVSRRIENLEKSLGYALIRRERQSISLLPAGGELFNVVSKMADEAGRITQKKEKLDHLHITGPEELLPYWTQVMANYDIQHLSFGDLPTEKQNILYFSYNEKKEYDFLTTIDFCCVASQNYSQKFGLPKNWEEIKKHQILTYQGFEGILKLRPWIERIKENSSSINYKSYYMYVEMLRFGNSIGLVTQKSLDSVDSLTKLSLDCSFFTVPIYIKRQF